MGLVDDIGNFFAGVPNGEGNNPTPSPAPQSQAGDAAPGHTQGAPSSGTQTGYRLGVGMPNIMPHAAPAATEPPSGQTKTDPPPEAPPASPENQANDDDAARQLKQQDDNARGYAALMLGLKAPQTSHTDAALAQRYGTTPLVVAANRDAFQQRCTLEDARHDLAGTTVLPRLILQNPHAAPLVQPDLAQLSQLEKTLQPPRGLLEDFGEELHATGDNIVGAFLKSLVQDARAHVRDNPGDPNNPAILNRALERERTADSLLDQARANGPQRWTGEVASGLGYVVTGPVAPVAMGLTGYESELRDLEVNHPEVDPETRQKVAAIKGSAGAVGGLIPGGRFVFGQGAAVLAKSAAKSTATVATAGAGLSVAGDEAASKILQAGGYDELAKQYVPTPEKAGENALLMGGVNTGMQLLNSALHSRAVRSAKRAEQDMARINTIGDTAAKSTLRHNDPVTFNQMVQGMADLSDIKDLYVDGKAFAQSMDKAGVSLDQLRQTMPDVAESLEQASRRPDGHVQMPVDVYAAHVAGSKLDAYLRPLFKPAPDPKAMTFAERQEFTKNQAEQMKVLAEKLAADKRADSAWRQSNQAVHEDILQKLEATAKYTPEMNRAYAALHRDFFTVLADRLGIKPHEAYEQYGADVRGDAAGEGFEQAKAYHGPLADFAEFARNNPADNGWFAPMGKVTDAAAERIKDATGIDTQGARVHAYASDVFHVAKGHPDLTDHDWNNALSLLEHHDLVGRGIPQRGAQGERINLVKDNGDGTFTGAVYEIVNSGKHGRRAILKTLFSDKRGAVENWFKSNTRERLGTEVRPLVGTPAIPITPERSQNGPPSMPGKTVPDALEQSNHEDTAHDFDGGVLGYFDPEQRIIGLLKNADASTFPHESAHLFLDIYGKIAARADAPAAIRQDMDALLKHFGVKDIDTWNRMSLEEQRPYHEQFAKSFETYLMEGTAPTPELRPLFAQIKEWILNVYHSLDALGIKLNPEVRGVMDRMLAQEKQAAADDVLAGYLSDGEGRREGIAPEEASAKRRENEPYNVPAADAAFHQQNEEIARDPNFVREAIRVLSEKDPDIFKMPISRRTTLADTLRDHFNQKGAETDPQTGKLYNEASEWKSNGALRVFPAALHPDGTEVQAFRTPEGENFWVTERPDGTLHINVSQLRGNGNGQYIYQAVHDYAVHNNKVFNADPAGLSDESLIRRTTNMLNAIVRHNTATHILPGVEQLAGNKELGVPPLNWGRTEVDKFNALAQTFVRTIENNVPQIKDIHYDPVKKAYCYSDTGSVVDDKSWHILAGSPDAQRIRAGQSSLRRAVFLKSLMDSEGKGQRERGRVLEALRLFVGGSARESGLGRLFQSAHERTDTIP